VCDAEKLGDKHVCVGVDSFIALYFGRNKENTRQKSRGQMKSTVNMTKKY